MGNTRWFEGGKKEPEYVVVEEYFGIKIIKPIGKNNTNTPLYSNSSEFYATYNPTTKFVTKISCYDKVTHVKLYDIEWGHNHGKFKKGTPHVQYYNNKERDKTKAYAPNKKQYKLYLMFKDKKVNI